MNIQFRWWLAPFCLLLSVAHADSGCYSRAVAQLRQVDPVTYEQLVARGTSEEHAKFDQMLFCDSIAGSLGTASHETLHLVDGRLDSYRLWTGVNDSVPKIHTKSFEPYEIRSWLPNSKNEILSDADSGQYLEGPQGTQGLDALLDEVNAYSRNLHVDVQVLRDGGSLNGVDIYARGALTSLMLYLKLALAKIMHDHPHDWSLVNREENKNAIAKVWNEAEQSLREACSYPELGQKDAELAGYVNSNDHADGLRSLLGRSVSLSQDCAVPKVGNDVISETTWVTDTDNDGNRTSTTPVTKVYQSDEDLPQDSTSGEFSCQTSADEKTMTCTNGTYREVSPGVYDKINDSAGTH